MESSNEEEHAQAIALGSLDQNRTHVDELLSSDPDETERQGQLEEKENKLEEDTEEKANGNVETGEYRCSCGSSSPRRWGCKVFAVSWQSSKR